jgi:hypothetical protein
MTVRQPKIAASIIVAVFYWYDFYIINLVMPRYKFYVVNFVIRKHELINDSAKENSEVFNNVNNSGNGYFINSLDEKSNPDNLIEMPFTNFKR